MRESNLFQWRMGLACGALTAICVIVGWMLVQSRLEVERGAAIAAANISSAIVQDEARNFEMLDLSLQSLRDRVSDPEVMAAPVRLRRAVLFDKVTAAADMDAILVLDADGRIVIDSQSPDHRVHRFGDSDFFRAHLHDSRRGSFISRPFLSPFDGEWTVALSRRIDRTDGAFAGVVVGMIKLAYFQKLFARLDVGSSGSVSLLAFDGTVLMHHPFDEGQIGRVLNLETLVSRVRESRIGSYEGVSKLDHVDRIYHYEQVGSLPLIQVVGFAVDEVFRPWWEKAAVIAATLLVLCGSVLGLVLFLQVELRKRMAAEAAFARLAATDKLTGLPNRRKFDEVLTAEWQRCDRAGSPLALLMIDVDDFKAYNDRYGHVGGDAVLASLASCLQLPLRKAQDFVARFGGEEFAVILADTDAQGALSVAERIRDAVARMRQPHQASGKGIVSVSIGISCLIPDETLTVEDLIVAADLALYDAKATGRDRVAVSRAERSLVAA